MIYKAETIFEAQIRQFVGGGVGGLGGGSEVAAAGDGGGGGGGGGEGDWILGRRSRDIYRYVICMQQACNVCQRPQLVVGTRFLL